MMVVNVAQFFQSVWNQIASAETAAGEIPERWFEVGGRTLRVRFIGPALLSKVTRPLSHLEVLPLAREPDLTIHCLDCNSVGVEFPRAPVTIEAFRARGEVLGLNTPRFHAASEGGVLSLMDGHRRLALYCVAAASDFPRFHSAAPLKAILSWFMRENGRQLLHGGAVGTPDGGVLLMGPSGAGKSNTALGSLASDLKFASDDFCAVSVDERPTVYSVYNTGKTYQTDWNRHPFLAGLAPDLDPEGRDKAIYFLNEAIPHKLILSFPLKAILVLRRAGEICEFHPISPAAVLRRTAPDTAKLLPDAGPEVMHSLAHLVRKVPCYELSFGRKPELIPSLISELLARQHADVS
jgi:hypothetical protein